MKKSLMLLVVLMIVSSLISDVKVVENPLNPDVDIYTLEKVKEIDLGDEASLIQEYIIIDDKIYVCDMQSKMVLIYNSEGEIVKIIDQTGNGPGELSMPTSVFDDSKFKRFGIVDQLNRRISYYDYEGEYIEDVLFQGMNVPVRNFYSNDYKIEFFIGIEFNQDEGSILSIPTIRTVKGEEINVLFTDSFNPIEMNVGSSNIPVFSYVNNNLYIARTNPDDYLINVINFDGSPVMDITKKYKKIMRSEKEIEEIEAILDDVKKQVEASGANIDMNFTGYEYQNAINSILSDDEGKIWVFTQNKEKIIFDIYDEFGEIIAQCEPGISIHLPKIFNGQLYDLDGDEDNGYKVYVYDIMR